MTTTPIAAGPNDVTVRTRFEQWYLRDLRGNPANLALDENGEYKYLPTLLLAFAAGEKTEREAWISCSDRMPEPYVTCIVGRGDVAWPVTAFWTGEKWCQDVKNDGMHVTHWRPMPSAPSNAELTGDGQAQLDRRPG